MLCFAAGVAYYTSTVEEAATLCDAFDPDRSTSCYTVTRARFGTHTLEHWPPSHMNYYDNRDDGYACDDDDYDCDYDCDDDDTYDDGGADSSDDCNGDE